MITGPNAARWLMIILLGCVLGFLFVFLSLSFVSVPPGNHDLHAGNLSAYRFQLSVDSRAKELTRVIESQLAAFRIGDYSKAYQYAASALTAQMSLPAFERMVKTGYPIMARSRSVAFGVILDNGEEAVVNVGIMGASGRIHHYQYLLQRERSGWKICGVTEVRFAGTTV